MADELSIALEHHQHGRLNEAASVYQAILSRQPHHADALHLLGVLCHQRGESRRAVELTERAIGLVPNAAAFHANLAEALRAVNELDRAAACCRTALRLQPTFVEAANNLGLVLMAQGQHVAASEQFQRAIKLRPNFALAHNNLGNAQRLAGEIDQALAGYRRAIHLAPNLADAHSNLGQLLFEQHELSAALQHCREAVRLQPNAPEALTNLGNVLRCLGQRDEAKHCYAEAIRLAPKLATAHNNLGQTLHEESDFVNAIQAYRTALRLEPQSARFTANLASALAELDQLAEAAALYREAMQLDPKYAEAHSGLGSVLQLQGDWHGALHAHQQAVQLKPSLAAAHTKLGQTLDEFGDHTQAIDCWREALRLNPEQVDAIVGLVSELGGELPDDDLAVAESLLAGEKLAESSRCKLHFSLAHVRDARQEFDLASQHANEANRLRLKLWRQQGLEYDPLAHERFVDQVIEIFDHDYFDRVRGWGLSSELPTFVVGLPRSGKSLVEVLLTAHPQVFGADELTYSFEAFDALPGLMNSNSVAEQVRRTGTLARRESYGDGQECPSYDKRATPLDCVSCWDRETVQQIAAGYLERLRPLDTDASRIVDTLPHNYLLIGFLVTLFPQSRIVHCRRDPRDIALACWMKNFQHIRWASDWSHLVSRIKAHQRLMDHWRRVLPGTFLEVDYEEAVADWEAVAQRLIEFVGLDEIPRETLVEQFTQSTGAKRRKRPHQIRLPLRLEFVGRWRHYPELPSLNCIGEPEGVSPRT